MSKKCEQIRKKTLWIKKWEKRIKKEWNKRTHLCEGGKTIEQKIQFKSAERKPSGNGFIIKTIGTFMQ